MPVKPAALPAWNTGLANNIAPSGGRQVSGFVTGGDTFASGEGNWLLNLLYQWMQYLDAPVGVTTTPGLTVTAGTGVGSVGLRGVAGDANSVPLLGVAGTVSGANETTAKTTYAGSGALGLTNVVLKAGVAGAGLLSGSAGIFGSGDIAGALGGVFAGNAVTVATVGTDAGLGVGAAIGSSTTAGPVTFVKQYGTARGHIGLRGLTSEPTTLGESELFALESLASNAAARIGYTSTTATQKDNGYGYLGQCIGTYYVGQTLGASSVAATPLNTKKARGNYTVAFALNGGMPPAAKAGAVFEMEALITVIVASGTAQLGFADNAGANVVVQSATTFIGVGTTNVHMRLVAFTRETSAGVFNWVGYGVFTPSGASPVLVNGITTVPAFPTVPFVTFSASNAGNSAQIQMMKVNCN